MVTNIAIIKGLENLTEPTNSKNYPGILQSTGCTLLVSSIAAKHKRVTMMGKERIMTGLGEKIKHRVQMTFPHHLAISQYIRWIRGIDMNVKWSQSSKDGN